MRYDQIVAARRELTLPGYKSLADVGMDGPWVTPYQIASKSEYGPVLLAKHWIDADSAMKHKATLTRLGYLSTMPFNLVFEKVLSLLQLQRSDFYITQIFHLLPEARSASPTLSEIDFSFDAVTRHELVGRVVIALGTEAAATCSRHGVPFVPAPHPSRRGYTFDETAASVANVISETKYGKSKMKAQTQRLSAAAIENRSGLRTAVLDKIKNIGPVPVSQLMIHCSAGDKAVRSAIDHLRYSGEPIWLDSRLGFWWRDDIRVGKGSGRWKREFSHP